MVLKPTNIHSNFFPSRTRGGTPQYTTQDAPESGHNGLSAGGAAEGTETQMQSAAFAPHAARGGEGASSSLEKKVSNENIILVDWDGRELVEMGPHEQRAQ